MSKKIVVNNCTECPYISHSGGFGSPAYIPICRKEVGYHELPYTKTIGSSRWSPSLVAQATGVIPDWCPLEDSGEEYEKD